MQKKSKNHNLNQGKVITTSNNEQSAKHKTIYGITEGETIEGRTWRETFWLLINRYGDETTVHAMNRICQRKTGFKERIIWSLGFLVALYCFTVLYAMLSERFRRKQFQTTVSHTFFPIYKVNFPELVVCNYNRLNWARLNESMDRYLYLEHRTPEFEQIYTDIVSRYDRLTVNSFYKFQGIERKYLLEFNYINFTNVVDFMSWRCDEILTDCKWRSESVNCCDIFFSRRTILGQCLSFNSIISEGGQKKRKSDKLWPWHYGRYGRGTGIQFRVLLNAKLHSPYTKHDKGVLFMTIDHGAFSDFLYTWVRESNIAYVGIWGSFSYMDKIGRSVPSNIRECVFMDEINSRDYKSLPGLDYEQENCVYQCQQLQMINFCNCTSDLFFPPGPYPICKLKDFSCLAKNWDNFDYFEPNDEYFADDKNGSFPCNCLFSCRSLLLQNNVYIESLQPEKLLEVNDSFVDMDFYWRQDYIMIYKTTLVISWLDLLVSFGGIASLLLGCSLISIVELIVFLVMETPNFLWKKHGSNKRLKKLKEKQSIQSLLDYDKKH